MLVFDAPVPPLARGDVLAVLSTGAYNYSMASHYNRLPKPAMVLVSQGRHALLVEREPYDDLLRQDRVPPWLEPAAPQPAGACGSRAVQARGGWSRGYCGRQ